MAVRTQFSLVIFRIHSLDILGSISRIPALNEHSKGTAPVSPSFSQPGTLNDAGVVAGVSVAADGIQHPVLWVRDQIVDLNHSGDHGLNALAFGINSLGRVSLQTENSAYDPNGEDFCLYGTHHVCAAAVWQGGRFISLPTLGGNNSNVGNVNSLGQIPGVAETAVSDPSCASKLPSQKLRYQAVIWGPDLRTVKPLRPLGNDTVSVALWVNDRGQAVGASGACSDTQPPPIAYGSHAILWEADGPGSNLYLLWAADINNRGEITGWGVDTSTGEIHTYLAVPNRMHDGSIPDVPFEIPTIAPVSLPGEIRQRLERGYDRQR